MSSRSKREECKSTEHDSDFSKWQVLIGPKDWEDYALGKDGVGRYRIHNLPQCFSCSGLYELAISKIPTEGRKSREPPLDAIVVVYLGHSDNVRARLQEYGRAGSHLERGNPSVCANNYNDLCLVKGPGLFKEAFSKGYSILFRWAPMTDKEEAKKIERKLLDTFDYPWNTRANGTSRRDDVLKISSTITGQPIPEVLNNLQEWKQLTFNKKVGIMISESVPPDKLGSSNYLQHFLIPLVRKVSTIQPRPNEGGEVLNSGYDICGVTDDDGSISLTADHLLLLRTLSSAILAGGRLPFPGGLLLHCPVLLLLRAPAPLSGLPSGILVDICTHSTGPHLCHGLQLRSSSTGSSSDRVAPSCGIGAVSDGICTIGAPFSTASTAA